MSLGLRDRLPDRPLGALEALLAVVVLVAAAVQLVAFVGPVLWSIPSGAADRLGSPVTIVGIATSLALALLVVCRAAADVGRYALAGRRAVDRRRLAVGATRAIETALALLALAVVGFGLWLLRSASGSPDRGGGVLIVLFAVLFVLSVALAAVVVGRHGVAVARRRA